MGRTNIKGYLTIYISLSLTVMLSLFLTLIDGARRNSVRLETEYLMDVAMNSVMAEYHRELFNQYNLFYIDTSYGSAHPSYYNTEARLKHYWDMNLSYKDVSYIDFVYKDLLGMQLDDIWLKEVAVATDMDGKLFQKKCAEAVWDDTGMKLMENVLEWVQIIESNGLMERNIEEEKQAVDEQLEAYNGMQKELANHKWITVEIQNPTQYMNEMRGQGILKWTLDNETVLSGQKVDLTQYISARRKRGMINQGNMHQEIQVDILEEILFQEYLIQYSGHYGKPKEGSLLQYQAEYVVAGEESDEENLRQVVGTICGIREVANTIHVMQDPIKSELVKLVSSALASAILCPELEPLFSATIMMGWAYLESLYDTKVLMAGGRVPLMKTGQDWHYDLDSILVSVDMQVNSLTDQGMSYEDYLHVLLYLSNPEKIIFRFMDLIEMDIRKTEGNEAFRMDGCIDYIRAEADVKSGYGYQYNIEREKRY